MDTSGPTGYVLEVDIDFPHEIHDLLDYFGVLPEEMIIKECHYSEYSKQLASNLGVSIIYQKRLVCNLLPKQKYIVHISYIQFCVKLGVKVTKIHRILQFAQSTWLKSFMDLCAGNRTNATDSAAEETWKINF